MNQQRLGEMLVGLMLALGCAHADATSTGTTADAAPNASASTRDAFRSEPPAAPSGFSAESTTFVSPASGWVLGTVPCPPSPSCELATRPVLIRTNDAGRSWTRAPLPADDNVNSVRFANPEDGWVWATNSFVVRTGGPDLWATHDGGLRWHPTTLPGASSSVSDLQATGRNVVVTVNGFPGLIETSRVNADAWVPSSTTLSSGAGGTPNSPIVLAGSNGWILAVNRAVLGRSPTCRRSVVALDTAV